MTKTKVTQLLTRVAFAALWLFIFVLPLTQATELPVIGPKMGLIGEASGMLALITGVVAVAARKRVRDLGSVHIAMAGFVLWSAITMCWSVAPALTAQRIAIYLQLFVLVLLLWEFCREEKDVLHLLSAFVIGTIIPAVSTLEGFLPGQQIMQQRASVAGFDPNHLAFMLALSLPIAYYLTLREKGVLSMVYRVQVGIAITAILLTGSAGSMIAMVVGLSIVFWTAHALPVRSRLNGFAIIAILGGGTMLFLPPSLWKHITEDSQHGAVTFNSAIKSGLDSVHTTPAVGFGAGTAARTTLAQEGHSSFTLFAETGVVGIVSFVVVLSVLVMSVEGMSGITKSFWFTVLAVWAVGVCSLNWECSQPAWILFGLLAAHSNLRQEGLTQAERSRKQNAYVTRTAEIWSSEVW